MGKSWAEYYIDERRLQEWLPWGGLVKDDVLRNKDESLMGFFSYTKRNEEEVLFPEIKFKNGWAIWTEYQKYQGEERCFLSVCWNPFYYKKKYEWVTNALSGKAVHFDDMVFVFQQTLDRIESALKTQVDVVRLKNKNIVEYLFSTLAMDIFPLDENHYTGYLDVQADKAFPFEIKKPTFVLNKKNIGIISLLGYPDLSVLPIIPYDYRFSRRMLLFGQKEAQQELNRYMRQWAPKRAEIKSFLQENILGEFNGFYTNNLVFSHEHEKDLATLLHDVDSNLQRIGVPHVVERPNLKDVWWGALPGIFRANLNPPIIGLTNIAEMLTLKEEHHV